MQPTLLSSRKGSAKIGPKPSARGEFLIRSGLCHCVVRHTRTKRKTWPCSGCHDMTNKHCLRLQTLTLNLSLLKKDAKIQMWSSHYQMCSSRYPDLVGAKSQQMRPMENCILSMALSGKTWSHSRERSTSLSKMALAPPPDREMGGWEQGHQGPLQLAISGEVITRHRACRRGK